MVKPPPLSKKSIEAISPKPVKNKPDIFKYIFFLSLLIFLIVAGAIVSTLVKSQQSNTTSTPLDTKPSNQATPTILSTQVCHLNDQEYQVGQSFPAADDCNTCTCQSDLIISCTDKNCDQ